MVVTEYLVLTLQVAADLSGNKFEQVNRRGDNDEQYDLFGHAETRAICFLW